LRDLGNGRGTTIVVLVIHCLGAQLDRGDGLADVVVQLARQRAPLVFLQGDDAAGECLQFGALSPYGAFVAPHGPSAQQLVTDRRAHQRRAHGDKDHQHQRLGDWHGPSVPRRKPGKQKRMIGPRKRSSPPRGGELLESSTRCNQNSSTLPASIDCCITGLCGGRSHSPRIWPMRWTSRFSAACTSSSWWSWCSSTCQSVASGL